MRQFVSLLLCLLCTVTHAAGETRLKVNGEWREDNLAAFKVDRRSSSQDPRRARIQGLVTATSSDHLRLNEGIDISLAASTSLEDGLTLEALKDQVVNIELLEQGGIFLAQRIRRGDASERQEVELLGTLQQESRAADGNYKVTIAGIPVHLPRTLYSKGQVRTLQQDDRRPGEQWSLLLFDRPLTVGGELGTEGGVESDRSLGAREKDDEYESQQELQIESYYPLTRTVSLFAEAKVGIESTWSEGSDRETEWTLERGETWLLWSEIADSYFSLQLGRQKFEEQREWWWDSELDAIRLHYDRYPFHAEVAIAEQLGRVSHQEDRVDPGEQNVERLLAATRWQINGDHSIAAFYLRQRDESSTYRLGQRIFDGREDESDARLTWFGLRLSGDFDIQEIRWHYWLDWARVHGKQYISGFSELANNPTQLIVDELEEQDVAGTGYDIGAWASLPFAHDPTLTLSYARGSAADGSAEDNDQGFIQTGLNDNNGKLNTVNRFRYYGEVLRPELSNLSILTAAVAMSFDNGSLALIWHRYRRVESDGAEPNVRVRGDFTDDSKEVGSEVDLVVGYEPGENWEFEAVLGRFDPGSAFAVPARDAALLAQLKVNFNF